ncbi:hypothetical protein [Streptomyces sp. NPDC006668]
MDLNGAPARTRLGVWWGVGGVPDGFAFAVWDKMHGTARHGT